MVAEIAVHGKGELASLHYVTTRGTEYQYNLREMSFSLKYKLMIHEHDVHLTDQQALT